MRARNGWSAHLLSAGTLLAFTLAPGMAQEENKQEEPFPLPPVTVTAPVLPTARPLPPEYKDHPAPVTVIPREEIESSRAPTLGEALSRVPGLNSLQGDHRGFFPVLGARGTFPFGPQGVKILLDGAPIGMNRSDPGVRHYLPPIETVERIDVIRGANSVLYGQTVGGVINILTRPIPEAPELLVRGSADSHGTGRELVSYGARLGALGYRLQYTASQGDGFRQNDRFTENDATLKLSLKPDPRADLDFTFNYYDLEARLPGPLSERGFREDVRRSETPNDHWEALRVAGGLNLKLALSNASKITASLYGNHFDRTFFGPTATRIVPKVLGGDLSHTLTTSLLGLDATLVTGLTLEGDPRDGLGFRPRSPGGRTGTTTSQTSVDDLLVAPYAQTTLTIFKPLALTGGLRFERLDVRNLDRFNDRTTNKTFDELVWSVGATYRPIAPVTFYGNIQRTFEVPTREAFGTAFAGIAFGVETAEAQTAIQYDLGVRTQPLDWLSVDLSVFRFNFENLPVITAGVVESIGESRHQGIEARIDVGLGGLLERLTGTALPTFRGLGAFTNLAFLDAEIVKFKTFAGNRVPYAPEVIAGGG